MDGAGPREMIIYKLSPDFLSFTAERTPALPGPRLVEAPAFFRRGGTYYALLGGCTCSEEGEEGGVAPL